MLDVFLRPIITFGIGLTLLLGLSQLFVQNKTFRNWCFFLFYLSLMALMITSNNIQSDLTMAFPSLYLLEVPFLFLLGPSMYNMFTDKSKLPEPKPKIFGHFLAPTLSFFLLLPYYLRGGLSKVDRLKNLYGKNEIDPFEILFALGLISLAGYLLTMFYRMRQVWTPQFLRSEWIARQLAFMLSFGLGAFSIALVGVLTLNFVWLRLTMAAVTLMISGIFLVGHRYPNFFHAFTVAVEQRKYKKSYLRGDDAEAIKRKLDAVMNEKELYTQDNLSAGQLAAQVDITSHQLSQYLNVYEQKNFSSFVNEYRVKNAIHILETKPATPIQSIGSNVGFNSQSSFTRAFRQVTGQTPQEYRKTFHQ